MESENSQDHALIIDHSPEEIVISDSGTNQGENKSCGGAPCGFSDAGTNSKDAKERRASMKKLLIAVTLCILFMSIEVVGGIAANSLAVLTDAAHLLSDVASFAISLFALWAAGWEATPRQTFGFFRIEVLGVLVSMQLIWLLTGILVYEAILRLLSEDQEVNGFLMFAVAAFGLAVNIVMAFVLGHDHADDGNSPAHSHSHGSDHKHGNQVDIHIKGPKIDESQQTLLDHSEHVEDQHSDHENVEKKGKNINVYSAYLHVLGDTIQSIGVMIGGAIIWYKPEWKIIDLICTIFFSVIVLATTIRMLRNVLEVLMESTPREIDAARVERGLCETEGVVAVHELHIWAITVGKVLLACHVTITPEADSDAVLNSLIGYLNREYNISHVTIQIERQ